MYYVCKRMEIAGCHRLELSYPSKCSQLHGHNWIVTVYCKARELNADGMVCDFTHIKERIHTFLENIARWITEQIPQCYKTSVQESEGNTAVYVCPGEDNAPL